MKITEDVRKFAAQQNLSDDEALKAGMEQKARASSPKRAPRFIRKSEL